MPKNSQFVPPALPPKKHKINSSNASLNSITTPPTSPKISNDDVFTENTHNDETMNVIPSSIKNQSEDNQNFGKSEDTENETVVLRRKASGMVKSKFYAIVLITK